jgi:pre-mRNA-splicing factor SYF1
VLLFRPVVALRECEPANNLRISFIAAQAAAARKGTEKPTTTAAQEARDAADPMAAMERQMAGNAPAFVASTLKQTTNGVDGEVEAEGEATVNPDAIQMDEDEF